MPVKRCLEKGVLLDGYISYHPHTKTLVCKNPSIFASENVYKYVGFEREKNIWQKFHENILMQSVMKNQQDGDE